MGAPLRAVVVAWLQVTAAASGRCDADAEFRPEADGWGVDDRLTALASMLEPRCTLRRASGMGMPEEAPALLAVPAGEWPVGLGDWANRTAFLYRHGKLRVHPRAGITTAQGGARHRRRESTAQLVEVVDGWREVNTGPAKDRLVFEPGSERGVAAPADGWHTAMAAELGGLQERLPGGGGVARAGQPLYELVLSVAPAGAGLPRHTHGPSWLALAAGAKFWVLHPPGGEWAADPRGPVQWLEELEELTAHGAGSSSSPAGVEWCLQLPGEVLLLPGACLTWQRGRAVANSTQRDA